MRLKLQNLQSVVQRVVREEKIFYALKEEVKRSLGPSIITEGRDIESICDAAMDHLDVLQARNVRPGKFGPSLAVAMLSHVLPEVRRLGARLAPVSQLHRVTNDKSPLVRCEVAKRIDVPALKEMMRRFPNDETIHIIYEVREEDGFDMYGSERLGDAVKQPDEQELTDMWYESLARKMVSDYEHQTEGTWRHVAVDRYVSAVKATSGVEIDPEKLLEAIDKLITERDDDMLDSKSLKETIDHLDNHVMMESTLYTMGTEDSDIVADLLRSRLGTTEYIARAEEVFSIREARAPKAVERLVLSEGVRVRASVPVRGELPHDSGFRSVDERALDLYVESWNKRRNAEGDPMRISWTTSADDGIVFTTKVR